MNRLTSVLAGLFVVAVIAAVVVKVLVDEDSERGRTNPEDSIAAQASAQPDSGAPAPATPRPPTPTATPGLTLVVTMASSITKRDWNNGAIEEFNAESLVNPNFQINGRPIQIEMILEPSPLDPDIKRYYRSPTQVQDTIDRIIEPVILSPANATWVAKLKKEWRERYGNEIVSEPAPALLQTPIVVAMWESRGRALGCWPVPEPRCTWESIIDLAKNEDGWASLGHEDWEDLRLAYATVGESDVATLTMVLLCGTGLGKPIADLTVADVQVENGCGDAMASVEAQKPRAAPSSPVILGLMEDNGPEYLDMATTYEKEVVAFNLRTKGKVREQLIAAYPQDGTVVADHPFAILDGAPWVSAEQVAAAKLFRDFLLSEDQQAALTQYGLRPARTSSHIGSPIDASNGVNPESNLVVLDVPDVLVIDQSTEIWKKVEKPSDIILVFDKSGSMTGDKIVQAVKGAKEFVGVMSGEDWVKWLPFDDHIYSKHVDGNVSQVGEALTSVIGGTTANGGTALYDAVGFAYHTLERRRFDQGDSRRYGIVVLSDGQNSTNGDYTLAGLESIMKKSEGDPKGIQIHTIGIGDDADERVLSKIAAASQGAMWQPEIERLAVIYRQIAKYF